MQKVPLVTCKKGERDMILTLPDWLLEVRVPHALPDCRRKEVQILDIYKRHGHHKLCREYRRCGGELTFEVVWEFLISIIEDVHLNHLTRFHPQGFAINNPGCMKRCTEYDFLPKV